MSDFDKNTQENFENEILARKWRNVITMLRNESKNRIEKPLTGNEPFVKPGIYQNYSLSFIN